MSNYQYGMITKVVNVNRHGQLILSAAVMLILEAFNFCCHMVGGDK